METEKIENTSIKLEFDSEVFVPDENRRLVKTDVFVPKTLLEGNESHVVSFGRTQIADSKGTKRTVTEVVLSKIDHDGAHQIDTPEFIDWMTEVADSAPDINSAQHTISERISLYPVVETVDSTIKNRKATVDTDRPYVPDTNVLNQRVDGKIDPRLFSESLQEFLLGKDTAIEKRQNSNPPTEIAPSQKRTNMLRRFFSRITRRNEENGAPVVEAQIQQNENGLVDDEAGTMNRPRNEKSRFDDNRVGTVLRMDYRNQGVDNPVAQDQTPSSLPKPPDRRLGVVNRADFDRFNVQNSLAQEAGPPSAIPEVRDDSIGTRLRSEQRRNVPAIGVAAGTTAYNVAEKNNLGTVVTNDGKTVGREFNRGEWRRLQNLQSGATTKKSVK